MTQFERKSFSVHVGGDQAYRDNFDRIFGKKEPAATPCCERDFDGDGNCDRHPEPKAAFYGQFTVNPPKDYPTKAEILDDQQHMYELGTDPDVVPPEAADTERDVNVVPLRCDGTCTICDRVVGPEPSKERHTFTDSPVRVVDTRGAEKVEITTSNPPDPHRIARQTFELLKDLAKNPMASR